LKIKHFCVLGWSKGVSGAIGFVGAAIGMLIMGVCGDLFGRRKALLFTLFVCAFGAFIAGCAAGTTTSAFVIVIVGKCIAGIGAGGLYPLGGCLAVERAKGIGANKVDTSAWVLSNQIPGKTWPYIVALIFSTCSHQVTFRAVFFGGIIVCFLCGFCAPTEDELGDLSKGSLRTGGRVDNHFTAGLTDRKWWWALVGTGGTWFLFDVVNYGTELATPDLVDEVFGDHDKSIAEESGESLAVLYGGIFGAAFSILWIRQRWSIKWLEILGFMLSMVVCMIMASAFQFNWPTGVKFTFLCVLQATLMIPNVTTYVAPLLTYPTRIRSSFNGWFEQDISLIQIY
jgi:MFS family permease